MEIKKTIFISHSAPEDNFKASWLAAKLKLLGYNVWVDIDDLRSGSSFWPKIEETLREKSIKFLALITSSYIKKSRTPKTGVLAEIMCATSINRENFIIPIRCDNTSFSKFPVKFLEFNAIDFNSNYGAGLKKLVKELNESGVDTSEIPRNVLKEWFNAQKICTDVLNREEKYYSSWFQVILPKHIYIHYPVESFSVLGRLIPYSYIRNGDYILGLFSSEEKDFNSNFSQKVLLNNFVKDNEFCLDNGEIVKDTQNKVVNLLNKNFASFLLSEEYKYYKQSNKKKIFYIPYSTNWNGYVSLKSYGKRGRRLFGKHKELKWRFAFSFNFQLYPVSYLNTQYHLVFSDENGLLDAKGQQKYRRSMPNNWFNRAWYERLIAIMYLISGKSKNNQINIITDNQEWSISTIPFDFISRIGYLEPNENV